MPWRHVLIQITKHPPNKSGRLSTTSRFHNNYQIKSYFGRANAIVLRPVFIKYSLLLIGALSIIVSVVYGNEQTLYIKPVFHIVLFLWYFSVKKKLDVKLVFFLGLALTAEFLTAIDFDGYYTLINILFACYFFVGLWCMKPVLQQSKFTLRGQEVFFGLLITGVLLYMVYGLIYYSIQEFQENVPTVLGGISFLLFTGGCFYVTLFHSHPKKFYLFVVGSCYFVVCLGYMVYQLLLPSDLLMGLVNTAEIIAQFYFVLFMIHKQEMLSKTKWYI